MQYGVTFYSIEHEREFIVQMQKDLIYMEDLRYHLDKTVAWNLKRMLKEDIWAQLAKQGYYCTGHKGQA